MTLSFFFVIITLHLLQISDSTKYTYTAEVQNTSYLHHNRLRELSLWRQNYSKDTSTLPCPPWYTYEGSAAEDCLAREHRCLKAEQLPRELRCSNGEGAQVEFGYCMTYNDVDRTFQLGSCHYFQLSEGHHITEQGFIELPDNTSQLNDYMCYLMHRQGPLCSECVDGYGLGLTETCSNCTGVWYGIPLYLITELFPITAFYFIILVLHVSLTSAPMTCYTFYSHVLFIEIINDHRLPVGRIVHQLQGTNLSVLKVLFGAMNLETLRFIVPPFCISSSLKTIHISLIEYVPAIYSLSLILMTWLCIELHGRNFRPLVWAWRPFHKCFVRLRRGWNTTSDLIDVFASFFLITYSKILFQSLLFIDCEESFVFSGGNLSTVPTTYYDPGMHCRSNNHIGLALFAGVILLVFNILPALLLVLYPVRAFRVCLSKCRLDRIAVATFVNKFHGCYRDGLHGGKDMRSFSGFYFFLRSLVFVVRPTYSFFSPNIWISYTILYSSCTLLMAFARPYKKTYMNVFDVIFLANLSLLNLLVSSEYYATQALKVCVLMYLPTCLLVLFIVTNTVNNKILKRVKVKQRLQSIMYNFCKSYRNARRIHQQVSTNDSEYTVEKDEGSDTMKKPVSSTVVSVHANDRTPLLMHAHI